MKFFTAEKSVFTNRGPYTGARGAVPSFPGSALLNAHGLNQAVRVCTLLGAEQPGFPATGPGLLGSPTSLGRSKLAALFQTKGTPDALPLSTTNRGNPESALSITLTDQPPKTAFAAPFQAAPYFLPFPNGRS